MKIKNGLIAGISILLASFSISYSANKNTFPESALMKIMNTMMSDMKFMNMGGNPDHDFAMMMIRHHKAAIEMAHYELQSGKDEKMKMKAEEIINKQTKEIGALNERNG